MISLKEVNVYLRSRRIRAFVGVKVVQIKTQRLVVKARVSSVGSIEYFLFLVSF